MRRGLPGILCVVAVGAVGVALHMQGWAGCVTNVDLVPHARDAMALVRQGVLPERGCLNSLASCNPPGSTWLLVPGTVWLTDPRLVQVPGGALLFLAALAGVYRLARALLARPWACACVVFYGFSAVGLSSATSLWPRFPQAASVWTFVLLVDWVRERRASALAGALLVWALGMYTHMEGLLMAPLFVALWLAYRPPLPSRHLIVAVLLALAVWWPYLRFDAAHNWTNFRSQITLRTLLYTPAAQTRVNVAAARAGVPALELPVTGPRPTRSRTRVLTSFAIDALDATAHKTKAVMQMTAANMGAHLRPPLLAWAAGLLLLGACVRWGLAGLRVLLPAPCAPARGRVRVWLGAALLVVALAGNEFVLARLLGRPALEPYALGALHTVEVLLAVVGAVLLASSRISDGIRRCLIRPASEVTVPAFGLTVIWVTAMAVADPDAPYRVQLLWPVQSVMWVVLTLALAQRVAQAALRTAPVVLCLGALLVTSPAHKAAAGWVRSGWSGGSAQVDALDALGRMAASATVPASIEYRYDCPAWVVYYGAIDDRYHPGMEFDWYLRLRHGVTNVAPGTVGVRRWRFVDREARKPVRAGLAGPECEWSNVFSNARYEVQVPRPTSVAAP